MSLGRSSRALPSLLALVLSVASLIGGPSARAQTVLNPGDHHIFLGAGVDAELSPGCDGVVNACGVDYGDLGADSPRMYVVSGVNVGVLGTTRRATGRLAHEFSLSPGPDHRIGAKLIGLVSWRGWLQAAIGAYDNTAATEIGVAIYDVTQPGVRRFVASQTVHTASVGGTTSAVPTFIRDIGRAGFALAVNLERGHYYLVAVEATCTVTSGVIGLFAASSYSSYGAGRTPLTDGYVEQTSMAITLEPDYLSLIDELRGEFESHGHTYLTGRGEGHNNTEAATSQPIDSESSERAESVTPAGGGTVAAAPDLRLITAAPNPSLGSVGVVFSLPQGERATLTLFDVQGRVAARRDVGSLGLGRHSLDWSLPDGLAKGVYLLRLEQAGRSVTTKVTLLR